jgi:hypothetical protein
MEAPVSASWTGTPTEHADRQMFSGARGVCMRWSRIDPAPENDRVRAPVGSTPASGLPPTMSPNTGSRRRWCARNIAVQAMRPPWSQTHGKYVLPGRAKSDEMLNSDRSGPHRIGFRAHIHAPAERTRSRSDETSTRRDAYGNYPAPHQKASRVIAITVGGRSGRYARITEEAPHPEVAVTRAPS